MTSKRFGLCSAVTMTGLTISLVLSACGPQPAENATAQSAAPSLSASATSSATAPATPTPTPSAEVPSPEVPAPPAAPAAPPAPPAAPAAPVQPALKTFTFPDGHISFSYPGSWSVRTQRGPGQEGPPWQPVEAVVSDRTGADLFSVSSGANGIGCSAGPVNRTVFDKAPVPGMREVDGTTPMFGFIVERSGGDDSYFMAVMNPRNLEEGDVSSQCTLLKMGNGAAQNRVIFNQSVYPNHVPGFPSRQAAKSWMATEQYAQLKALMLSLMYS